MKPIKIGPDLNEITVTMNKITAPFQDKTITYTLPEGMHLKREDVKIVREAFWDALLFATFPWQIANFMNILLGGTGLIEVTPVLGTEEVQLR